MCSKWQPQMEIGFQTHIGRREENQDFFGVSDHELGRLLIVCDGMGGNAGGSRASWLCTNQIQETFANSGSLCGIPQNTHKILEEVVVACVQQANTRVYEESQNNPHLQGMGTTCVLAIIYDSFVYYANVGDSRAYLIGASGGNISQLTKDHSLVQLLIDEGELSEIDAATSPNKHVITRAIGIHPVVTVDTGMIPAKLTEGDALLLCTDGLSAVLDAETICRTTVDHPPQEACNQLVELAYNAGSEDNITVLIAKLTSDFKA
jgi:PPM family protein phosphatase